MERFPILKDLLLNRTGSSSPDCHRFTFFLEELGDCRWLKGLVGADTEGNTEEDIAFFDELLCPAYSIKKLRGLIHIHLLESSKTKLNSPIFLSSSEREKMRKRGRTRRKIIDLPSAHEKPDRACLTQITRRSLTYKEKKTY